MSPADFVRDLKGALQDKEVRRAIRDALGTVELDPADVHRRFDESAHDLRAVREDFKEALAVQRREFQEALATGLETLRKELAAQRKEFQEALAAQRKEFQEALAAQRKEFQEGLEALRKELAAQRKEFLEGLELLRKELAAQRRDFQERFDSFDQKMLGNQRRMDALGARWGILAEESFREGMQSIVNELLPGYQFEKWRHYDADGAVLGYPAEVEVDLAIKDGKCVLVEIKSSARSSDVAAVHRIAQLYERHAGRKPDRVILVTPYPTDQARFTAGRLGIAICSRTTAGEPD